MSSAGVLAVIGISAIVLRAAARRQTFAQVEEIPISALTPEELTALRSDNEMGFVMCRLPGGRLTRGPVSTGTHTRLSIQTDCPTGSKRTGIFHTHPGGVPYPSALDVRSAKQIGAKTLCIASGADLRCYRLRGK